MTSKKNGRPGCEIEADELKDLFYQYCGRLEPDSFSSSCLTSVHSRYAVFFKALLACTRALKEQVVKDALPQRFSAQQRRTCAKNLGAAFSDLLLKARNYIRKGRVPKPAGVYEDIFAQLEASSETQAASDECPVSQNTEVIADASPPEPELELAVDSPPRPLYALEAVERPAELARQSSVTEVLSSQECQQEENNDFDYTSLPSWWDANRRQMAVQVPGGHELRYANVTPGPRGFLLAKWPDGTEQETEVSNIVARLVDEKLPGSPSKPLKRPAAAAAGTSAVKRPAAAAAQASAAKRPAAAAAAPAAAPAARPAAAADGREEVIRVQSPHFGHCKSFMNNQKAYIQYWDAGAKRWPSVVNLAAQQCRHRHKDFLRQFLARLEEPGFGPEEVAELKAELIAS
jgi:chemotaxis protein histidine kinase CheA